jgi:hypothetical protein
MALRIAQRQAANSGGGDKAAAPEGPDELAIYAGGDEDAGGRRLVTVPLGNWLLQRVFEV